MKRGLDTNVLVHAHIASTPGHERVRRFLLDELADPERVLVVTPLVLHELVHAVTDSRRFEAPLSMPEALAVTRLYLDRANVECVPADEASVRLACRLIEHHHLGRKRVADALLAATFLRHGVGSLATRNVADFEVFDGLEVVDPLA